MTPEQQSEMKRREEKKSFATACAHALVVHLAPVMESVTAADVAKRVWDIAEAMANEREERGSNPML